MKLIDISSNKKTGITYKEILNYDNEYANKPLIPVNPLFVELNEMNDHQKRFEYHQNHQHFN